MEIKSFKMAKYFLIFLILTVKFNKVNSQTCEKCFADFNLYKNEGSIKLGNCNSNYFVKCFSKNGEIYKVIAINHGIAGFRSEYIRIEGNGYLYTYSFPKTYVPSGKALFRFRSDKRIDTMIAKNDTLYFKKAFPNYIQLSKYFKLGKDTLCVVSYHYKDLNKKLKKELISTNFHKWGTNNKYTDYTIIKVILNDKRLLFVSKLDSDRLAAQFDINSLNKIIEDEHVPPSLFWLCIIFRFLI